MIGNMGCPPVLKRTAVAIAVAQAVVISVGHTASITVDNGGDANVDCTFREAVATVNAGADLSNDCFLDTSSDPLGSNDSILINVSGNSIVLSAGEILISSDVSINPGGGDVIIAGSGGRILNITSAVASIDGLTLIDGVTSNNAYGGGAGIYAHDSEITLSNSTISGNSAYFYGGGIYTINSSLTLINSNISGNSAGVYGGGIYAISSTITLHESTVMGNHSNGRGGGISANFASILTLNDSVISSNSASAGGGISAYRSSGTVRLNDSVISGNSASVGAGIYSTEGLVILYRTNISQNYSTNRGGGIYASNSTLSLSNSSISGNFSRNSAISRGAGIFSTNSSVALKQSSISGNSAGFTGSGTGIGSGIYANASILTIEDSTISQNTAEGNNGGGIYAYAGSETTIINSTISENYADFAGGIVDFAGTVNIINSTISGNSAFNNGGFITYSSSITLTNSTISGNSANTLGGFCSIYSIIDVSNTIIAGNAAAFGASELNFYSVALNESNNLFGESSQTSAEAFYGFSPDPNTIIATSDGNAPTGLSGIIAPLGNNGGPTQTHALVQGSPAIDAGNNVICAAAPVNNLDQRGQVRPLGSICDIGSFEGTMGANGRQSAPNFFVVPLPNGDTVIFGL